ncbi:MAG: hypothetical protein GX638_11950 [Crenarchaeota archaeon]|nr:hypothetical protein [Thermoproteota archaeon]
MKKSAKLGIIVLAIGLSLLLGTVYRSTLTNSISLMNGAGVKPGMWSSEGGDGQQVLNPFFLSPRDLRLDVTSNGTIDLYVLDSEGIQLWTNQKTLKPIWSFFNVSQDIFNLHINSRNKYAFVIFNPSNSTSTFKMTITLHSYETDLLAISMGFLATGILITTGSIIRKTKKQ